MGLPGAAFWALRAQGQEKLPAAEQERLPRAVRQRARGGGREFAQPLVLRVALVLTYLRLHLPQEAVAPLSGATPAEVSRELCRLLPVIPAALPWPAVWEPLAAGADLRAAQGLEVEQVSDRRARIDATAQRVSRPTDNVAPQEHYSGKKSFTLKTQLVIDGEPHSLALSQAGAGRGHDKKLSDALQTTARWPEGCAAEADKG